MWPALADAASAILVVMAISLLLKRQNTWRSAPLLLALFWLAFVLFSAVYAATLGLPGNHLRSLEKHIPVALGSLAAVALSASCAQLRLRHDTLIVLFLAGLVAGGAVTLIRNGVFGLFAQGWPEFTAGALGKINRNYAALTCGLSIVAACGLITALHANKSVRPIWNISGIVVLFLALVFESFVLVALQSRTGYIATATGLAVWVIALAVLDYRACKTSKQKLKWIIPLLIIIAVTAIGTHFYPLISTRLNGNGFPGAYLDALRDLIEGRGIRTSDVVFDGGEERLKLMAVAAELIKQRPLLGWGPDATKLIGLFSPFPSIRDLTQFHNGYLQILVSFGFVGALFFVALLVAIVSAGLRKPYDAMGSRIAPPLLASLLSLIVYLLVTNFTESIIFVKPAAMICMFCAALACMRAPLERDDSGATS